MARQNRWATFGQAFNAVYDAGTSLGEAIQTGGIAFKSYEDEEGNKLSGLALDRAKMDDYAAAEQRWGDPMEALRMRTGVETLGQNKLKTDYDAATYDERVYQGGIGASRALDANIANTQSATGLNIANTGYRNEQTRGLGYTNDYTQKTFDASVEAGNAAFNASTAKDTGLAASYNDPSYVQQLIAKQRQGVAESDLATSTANLQASVVNSKEYQDGFIAAEKAKVGATATMLQIEEQMANDPRTLQMADEQLQLTLNNTMTAVADSETALKLSQDAGYQANQLATGLSNAERNAVQGEEAVMLAQQSLAANTFIKEWSKTGNPDDPASMRNLVKGISQINPMMGQKLAQDYGEHELWEITNRSLRMRAETNEALSTNGAAGAREVLDKYNGEDMGMRIDENDDGSMAMVEVDKEGNIVRTVASGADEKAFVQDLNAILDPASMMEYSMNLVDMDYKRALAKFTEAQAKSAGVGRPMGATDLAYRTMVDPSASSQDRKLAMAFLMKDNPDLYAQLTQDMDFSSLITPPANGETGVPDKLATPVDINAPVTVEEETAASDLMGKLLAPGLTADDRAAILSGDNEKILAKTQPEFLEMERNKSNVAQYMAAEIQAGKVKLTPAGMEELVSKFQNASEQPDPGGHGADVRADGRRLLANNARVLAERPTEVLQILISSIKSKIKPKGVGHAGRTTAANNAKYNAQLAELETLIAEMQGR